MSANTGGTGSGTDSGSGSGSDDSIFRVPSVFVSTAMRLGWFSDASIGVKELIQLISSYACRFGMYG